MSSVVENNVSKGYNESQVLWKSYSAVYDLMDSIPYVKKLRDHHVAAMHSCEFILDAGCGTGLISRDLAQKNKRVFGIDINEDMVNIAAYRLQNFTNVRLHRGDVLSLPFEDNTFDGCVSNNVLHFIDDSDTYFSELVRVTKSGGILSIASARPCCDMEVLVSGAENYFASQSVEQETMNKIKQIAESNRSLMGHVKTRLEPEQVSKLLLNAHGCRSVLFEGRAYLDQSFHVIVKK